MKDKIKKLKAIKSIDLESIRNKLEVIESNIHIQTQETSLNLNLNNFGLGDLTSLVSYRRGMQDIHFPDKLSCTDLLTFCNDNAVHEQLQLYQIQIFKNNLEKKLKDVKSKRSGNCAFI